MASRSITRLQTYSTLRAPIIKQVNTRHSSTSSKAQFPHGIPLSGSEGVKYALEHDYDPSSFWHQPIGWGDLDSFRHVNNVRYSRFFENGRMQWIRALAYKIGGDQAVKQILEAKGISLILKSINVNFRRPVTFPDTLMIAHKALPPTSDPSHITIHSIAYSEEQRTVVAESSAVCVWYDYDHLRKCKEGPPKEFALAFHQTPPASS